MVYSTDASCHHVKVETHIDRELAANPGLVQIENGWRSPKELWRASKSRFPKSPVH